jgi:murein DD-endopeptidase MepM/ murein hydrolase activator NlpD
LGNSGRTTGAHLHYEILFKDRNVNPMKFIKAGRNVFQEQ